MKNHIKNSDGSIIISILIVTLFLSTFIFSLIVLANSNLVRARGRVLLLQSQYAAESGADTAIAQFNNNNTAYTGSGGEVIVLQNSLYKSTFQVTVADGASAKEKIVTSVGRVYAPANSSAPSFFRRIEVIAQRTGTTASLSMVSRNIIEIQSGVKNIRARDVYANGYINMNKNTTNLIAENITIADKKTGASNCSLGGSGNLLKPSTFSNPGQTKTKILVAYNNCINPPGNVSNANFDVSANISSISKIQSTFIPWSQYMDSSYQNSPGGCSDWSGGSFPRDIPSTGNTKKTHYPDSNSGVSSSCGATSNLNLTTGQYNIRDHLHLRANLCGTVGCSPTFNNPDAAIKFVFVEGTINFLSVDTAVGSGPIVFISYGTDPSAKNAVCPLGGAVYLGSTGNSTAPAIYLLANNGICLDKTKFGANPALGGISGKNIYVATNPGTPFDLGLDTTFPVDQIPIDLAWRAVRYRRL